MDTQLVEKIVHEVKSQGVFDEFRKDSIADVDTKPAYQNLRHRVENTVKKFLSEQKWSLDTNKNQLREKLRRHITESGFLDVGVERIVDQVVNPKIGSVFQPRIEEIAYKYLGLPPPPKKFDPPPPPLMHPLPPLPLNAPPPLKIETSSLLPTDLEQVSPDSDNTKSEGKDDGTTVDMDTEEKLIEDEDESPPFEPLVKYELQENKDDVKVETEKDANIKQEIALPSKEEANKFEESNEALIKTEIVAHNTDSLEVSHFATESTEIDKETNHSLDVARISQDSQLSSVSSDSRLSAHVKDISLQSSSQEAVAANISEEAQMPKFNENSSEPNVANGNACEKVTVKTELHFDIKKDEIKFEGTERKIGVQTFDLIAVKSEEDRYSSIEDMNVDEHKNESFHFVTEKSSPEVKEEDAERTPTAQDLSFGSSIDDSSSVPPSQTPINASHNKETPPDIHTLKASIRPTTPTTPIRIALATTSPVALQKPDKDYQRNSFSSSSKHKKHSKEHRRRSHEREKDKDIRERHFSAKDTKHSSKHHYSSGTKSSANKHSSSSSSSKFYSSHSKSTEKDIEKYSSSSGHSSSKHAKHSNSHSSSSSIENQESRKSKRDSDRRHRSSSSSKRSERKDDHAEAKQKLQRRKTTDSNDDDDDGNRSMGGGKSSSQRKASSSSGGTKSSKSSSSENKSYTSKTNEYQKYQTETKESYGKLPPSNNNVVILNDLLENPQTQFIQLNKRGHLIEMPLQQKPSKIATESKENVPTEFNNNVELVSLEEKYELEQQHKDRCGESLPQTKEVETEACSIIEENQTNPNDLLYFEETHLSMNERLTVLNTMMDLCRSAVNSLRFDSLSDEGIELSNEEDANCDINKIHLPTDTLKRKLNCNYDEFVATQPRKRFISNESEGCQSKASPTPSDTSSVHSKENEEICKNTNCAKKSLLDNHKAMQKLTQQQRYSSEDLYKPRPILGQRSRRRGMDSLA